MLVGLVLGGTLLDGAPIEPAQHLAAGCDLVSEVHMEGIFALHLFLDDIVGRDRVVGPRLSVPEAAKCVVAGPEIRGGFGGIDLDRSPASRHGMERIIPDQCLRRSDSKSASPSIPSSARSRSCATRGGAPMTLASTASGFGTISFHSTATPTEINSSAGQCSPPRPSTRGRRRSVRWSPRSDTAIPTSSHTCQPRPTPFQAPPSWSVWA